MKRRLLATILVLGMVLVMLPGTAWAAGEERGYYGSKLSDEAQIVYDGLCKNIDKIAAGEPVYIPLKRLLGSDIRTDTELNAVRSSVPDARRAFDADRPDVFWSHGTMSYGTYITDDAGNIYTSYYLNQEYIVGVTVEIPVGVSWDTGGRSVSGDRIAVGSKVASIVAEAQEQSTTVEQLKFAHDWLTQNNAYNQAAANTAGYVDTNCTPWSAISALGIDSQLAPVCEGYSRAFKMICDQLGIPCVLVSGRADGSDHMWNYVQLEEKWYAVDVTFDDPILVGSGAVDGPGRDTYFLVGENTVVDGTQTFAQTHRNDADLPYPELADDKYAPSTSTPADVEVHAENIEVTLPATVTTDLLRGTATANGVNVAGTWSFVDAIPTTAGTYTVKVRFTPNDTALYNAADTAITVTISTAEDNDRTVTVHIKDGKYTDSNGYGEMPAISSNGDTAYIPAGATGLILEFTVPTTSDIVFSDDNVTYDKCPNSNCIFIDGDCGLTATGAGIYDEHKILYLDFLDGTAKPGTLDITFAGFALSNAPGQLVTDKDGHVLTSNTLHLVVQGNNTPDETGVRVDFFPNGGTITSIKGYTCDQIMQGDPAVPDDILFIDVNSGIAGMMTDENGTLSDFPVVEREGYTFDGWWYIEDSDVINSAYDREVTDFANAQKVDHSTSFTKWAYGDWNVSGAVIAKWTKNSGETDNTHEVWFHMNGGTVTSVLGVSTSEMEYGSLYDSNGNWIYAESPDEGLETLGVMITDKSGKLAGLPVIEREGYTFDGWYTMKNGGNKITEDYTFTGAGEYGRDYLWAHWVPFTEQPGDLNGDGKVTMADVMRLARGAAGYVILTEQEQTAGDVTGDGKITMADVIRVARYAAGYSTSL